jgi:NAD(P)-dependent dehydrogenase (short-subunit alcohol dehydrogenase family)
MPGILLGFLQPGIAPSLSEADQPMSKRLDNNVAIVFGAGSIGEGWGNGKATATLFAREGALVVCVEIRQEAARDGGHHSGRGKQSLRGDLRRYTLRRGPGTG